MTEGVFGLARCEAAGPLHHLRWSPSPQAGRISLEGVKRMDDMEVKADTLDGAFDAVLADRGGI